MTTIKYELPKESFVRIAIYDLMGHKVRDLVNQNQNAGYQTVIWNATDNYGRKVSSGYYIYIMDTEGFHKTQKMILLK
jgi:flagellar hook assembly protein FlgD